MNSILPLGMLYKNPLDKLNPNSPSCDVIGNKDALTRLSRYAFSDSPVNLSFVGPAGVGKTTIARAFAEAKDIPLVEIQPQSVNTINDVLASIADNYERRNTELIEVMENHFKPEPIAVFFDEVHALKNSVIQGLLKATEPSDRTMITEKGFSVDCSNINWIIATTELGLLSSPFKSRFNLIRLYLYTKSDIAKIINKKYPNWNSSICKLVSYYCGRVPREALALANDLQLEINMQKKLGNTINWEDTFVKITQENNIDAFGMRKDRCEILNILRGGPVSKARLCAILCIEEEELIRDVLPPLMVLTEESSPYVSTCSRGYFITDAGLEELNKRK